MSLGRQGRYYLLVGLVQYVVDWAILVVLSHLGVPVPAANLAGRVAGALLGYWLNGRFTFAGHDTALGRRQFSRFLAMWLGTTLASTWGLSAIDQHAGLGWVWLAKPGVELTLGGLSFLISRHWVYRR